MTLSSRKAIITRPEHDKVTTYLSDWSDEVILSASVEGVQIKDLGAEHATRAELEKYMTKQNPGLVLLNGHGDPDCIKGHNEEVLIKSGENEHILKDKIVYALSCNTAAELGVAAINAGAKAYIGYDSPFCFLTNKNKECTPNEDELANSFKEASNQIPLSLIKGKTVKVAHEKSQIKFRELIKNIGSSDALPESQSIRVWLFWDMSSQLLLGDPSATF